MSLSHVCGIAAKNVHSQILMLVSWKNRGKCGDKEFLSFIRGKQEWESPPSILVTRNPN